MRGKAKRSVAPIVLTRTRTAWSKAACGPGLDTRNPSGKFGLAASLVHKKLGTKNWDSVPQFEEGDEKHQNSHGGRKEEDHRISVLRRRRICEI